jgi:hypothetical protein
MRDDRAGAAYSAGNPLPQAPPCDAVAYGWSCRQEAAERGTMDPDRSMTAEAVIFHASSTASVATANGAVVISGR